MECETNSMKEIFPYWTSADKEIDELIRYTIGTTKSSTSDIFNHFESLLQVLVEYNISF